MAKLYFHYGAMNCGKTSSLLQSIHNYETRGLEVMLLKPIVDTKGEAKVVSRIGLEREVDHLIDKDEDLYGYINSNDDGVSCIFVDEAQFLKRCQVDDLMQIVIKDDIPVMCYGLRTDFQSKLFPGSKRLFELADDIEEIKATCGRCGKRKECINARFDSNGDIVIDGEQVVVGGDDKYRPICRKCWKELVKEKKERMENDI